MSRIRMVAMAATLVCSVFAFSGVANAQTTPMTKKVAVTGTKGFKGTYTIQKFVSSGGRLYSVGTLKGTLKEKSFKLDTFYGPVELPVEKVIGLINVGEYRPRQLVVTADGEIFGGKLEKETIGIELSSGQVTQVPLGQINRLGYRKRAGEPEEWPGPRQSALHRGRS